MRNVKAPKLYGNAEVVELFKMWLAKAQKGKICHATVTTCELPNLMACDFAGSSEMEFAVTYALDMLKLKLGERARMGKGPPAKATTADYACYNVGACPVSYDFVAWLIEAEMTRIREGAPSPLRIAFAMGQDGQTGLNTNYRREMFAGVVRPLLKMLGAVEDQSAMGGRNNEWYVLKNVTAAARQGETVPLFKPSAEAMSTVSQYLEGHAPVTITLRESTVLNHRNSNLDAWLRLSDYLESQGEAVIFVRDTAKAGEPIKNKMTFPMASLNLDARLALYEQSKVNLFVANGPWYMALFGSRPWLMFAQSEEDDPYQCNRPSFWRDSQGVSKGEQFPWSKTDQRIVWEADTYENILKAWEKLNDHSGTTGNEDRASGTFTTGHIRTESAS